MKLKNSFLALVLLFTAYSVNAQLGIGVRAGINFSNISSNAVTQGFEPESVVGTAFAIPIEIRMSEKFAIQPEILYHTKGSTSKASLLGVTFSSKTELNYIEIPVLAKAQLGSDVFGLNFLLGPSIAYAMSGKITTSGLGLSGSVDVFDENDDKEFYVSRTDFNLQAGLSPYLNLGDHLSVFLDARYILGLTDITEEENIATIPVEDYLEQKNRVVQVSLGALFRF